jgi:hypothetical protein
MGFQHTIYLKRNESTLNDDNLDGRTYYWQCGARDLVDVVRKFGSVKEDLPDGYVTFTPLQLLKLISAMSSEIYEEYRILKDGYDDFCENVIWAEDQSNVNKLSLDSYSILREVWRKYKDIADDRCIDNFEEPHKMTNILTGLYSIVETMKPDDILIWKLSC